jgi:hypothetical protein
MPGANNINWNMGSHTGGADRVLDLLCQDVINQFDTQPGPMMPIVVLQAQEPGQDPAVAEIVQVLYEVFRRGRFMCTDPSSQQGPEDGVGPDGPGEPWHYDRALEMLRTLTRRPWGNSDNSVYRPYSFPRSRILAMIEDAVAEVGGQAGGAPKSPQEKVLDLLGTEWKPARPRDVGSALSSRASILGPLLVVAVGALLGHLTALRVSIILASALVVWLVVLGFQFVRRNRGPLSWLGQASLWFATTTFLFPERFHTSQGRSGSRTSPASRASRRSNWNPRRSWRVRQDRARLVIGYLTTTGYRGPDAASQSPSGPVQEKPGKAVQEAHLAPAVPEARGAAAQLSRRDLAWRFYLQLRVLALLEDLRASHRPWTLDLRRRKRNRPPLLFLPAASRANGGLALLQAVSDVRSRRSEQDPLLILASAAHGTDFEHWQGEHSVRVSPENMYEAWSAALRVDQSPSLKSTWPWVLRYPLTARNLVQQTNDKSQPVAPRPAWAWAWSRLSAACLLIIFTAAAAPYQIAHENALRSQQEARQERQRARLARLTRLYCGGPVTGSVHDLMQSRRSPGQCVGIDTTDALDFVPRDGGVRLNGTVPGSNDGESAVGARVSLRRLEQLMMGQNRKAERASKHVTFVYAGALTTSTNGTGEAQALNSVKELAGVYAWQYATNSGDALVKVRIDIANGGQNLASVKLMAQKIAAAARRDRTIVGVIGLGRDTPDSLKAVQELGAAGLAVVDTTNSDDGALTQQWNYFGMAATNAEEARALRAKVAGGRGRSAVVFQPSSNDPYSQEQASAATAMLRRAGFRLVGGSPLTYQVSGDTASFANYGGTQGPICDGSARPSVIYLAGRSGDLDQLLALLNSSANCFAPHVTVLGGDDLTKTQLTDSDSGQQSNIPSNATVYYVALTDVAKTGRGSPLNADLSSALNLPSTPPYQDPFFTDGTVALGFDATHALYLAATEAGGERYAVPGDLRCTHITNAATGQVWFNGVHHGIAIVTVPSDTQKPSYAYTEATGLPCAGAAASVPSQ